MSRVLHLQLQPDDNKITPYNLAADEITPPVLQKFQQVLTTVFQTSVCVIFSYVFMSKLQPYIIQSFVRSHFELCKH